ncbi:hypothetical protein DM02DRAFT_609677 [Periconia macrospinosa]|uniref:Uncharacterized protein n=1 Tax=Periconia macrospinosa TaxID=97972 RepID=A0A2V1E7I9_9PLEO|nr:hypothetical protein DM02DRAFT_609677 [Periconia macrospinosa]
MTTSQTEKSTNAPPTMSTESKPSTSTSPLNPILSFLALYLTTLFSLDTWAAARSSPYRSPISTAYNRPANMPPPRDSYQGRMHGQGRYGPGGPPRGEGRLPATRDSRAPLNIPLGGGCSGGGCG